MENQPNFRCQTQTYRFLELKKITKHHTFNLFTWLPHCFWWRKAYLPPQSQSYWICWTLSRPGGCIVESKRNRTQHDIMQLILFVTAGHISAWIDPGVTTVTAIAPALGTEWTVTRWTSLVTGPWTVYSESSTGLTKRWQYWVLLYTYMIATWSTTVCCKHVSNFNHVIWQLPWSVCVCRQRGWALTSNVHNPLKSPYASHGGVQQWVVSMNASAENWLKKRGTDHIVKRNHFPPSLIANTLGSLTLYS